MWPEPTLLRDKLYGNLEEVRRTAAFVRTIGASPSNVRRRRKKKKQISAPVNAGDYLSIDLVVYSVCSFCFALY